MGSHLSFCVNTTAARWGQGGWHAWEQGEQKAQCPEFSMDVNRTPNSKRPHMRITGSKAQFIGKDKPPPMSHKDMKSDRNGSLS